MLELLTFRPKFMRPAWQQQYRSIYAAGPQQLIRRPQLLLSINGTHKQKYGRTLDRFTDCVIKWYHCANDNNASSRPQLSSSENVKCKTQQQPFYVYFPASRRDVTSSQRSIYRISRQKRSTTAFRTYLIQRSLHDAVPTTASVTDKAFFQGVNKSSLTNFGEICRRYPRHILKKIQ